MACTNCIKINPLPKCVDAEGSIELTGITFPDNTDQEIFMVLHNLSTDRPLLFTLLTDLDGEVIETNAVASVGINLTAAYNLMNHKYKLEFLDKITMEPITALVGTTEGCCVEFTVISGMSGSGEYVANTEVCDAT